MAPLQATELQKAVEAGAPGKGCFHSCISFDSLAPSRADDRPSFLGEDWQGEVAALSLLTGDIITTFMFQKVMSGQHAFFDNVTHWSLLT